MYLAAAGVGTLGIVEFDTVDESNLQRQIIHGQSDVGRSKAESARDSIKEINPLIDVRLHETRLDSENVLEIFAEYDLIVDGTDNFATRYLVNDACVLLNKPYVWGSIYRFDGQVSVFWNEHGPNYRDLYPVPAAARHGARAAPRAACSASSARPIGAIQATEAVKLITGIGETLLGRLMVYDALEMTFRTIKVRKDPEGEPITELIDYEAFCGVVSVEAQEAAAGSTITVDELKDMMDAGKDFELIDVREPNEYEIVSIPGAKLIPKDEILSGRALAQLPQRQADRAALQDRCALGRGARRGQERRLQGRRARAGRRDGVGHAHRQDAADVLTCTAGPPRARSASPSRGGGPGLRACSLAPWPTSHPWSCSSSSSARRRSSPTGWTPSTPDQWDDESLPGWTRRGPRRAPGRASSCGCRRCWPASRTPRAASRTTPATCSATTRSPAGRSAADEALSAFAEDDALVRTVHLSARPDAGDRSTSSR